MSALSPLPAEPVMPAGPWLLVVGMHRSGTSALTGALGRLGMALPVKADRYRSPRAGGGQSRALGKSADGAPRRRALGSWAATWGGAHAVFQCDTLVLIRSRMPTSCSPAIGCHLHHARALPDTVSNAGLTH